MRRKIETPVIITFEERIAKDLSWVAKTAEGIEASPESGQDLTAIVSLDESIGQLARAEALQSQEISLGLKEKIRRRLAVVRRAPVSLS
ncbi:MAG: hypothetical protein HKL90_03215 [Elusimicrobia bacterium]|nr:hypothetical protein [Elusimicrobiota bacterium]